MRSALSRNQRCGGEGGIRTPDTLSGMPVFKTGAINRSATSPESDLINYLTSPGETGFTNGFILRLGAGSCQGCDPLA